MNSIRSMALGLLLLASSWRASATVMTDGRGRPFDCDRTYQRIVSTSLASDEILWALHPDREHKPLLALSSLAANDQYSQIADAVAKSDIKTVGSDPEVIVALKPDLVVVASFNRPELLKLLEAAGIKTFVLDDFNSIGDIKRNIAKLGCISGGSAKAKDLIHDLDHVINTHGVPEDNDYQPSVLSYDEAGSVMAKGTLFDDVVRIAGGRNAASELGLVGWPKLSPEALTKLNPDFIVALGQVNDRDAILKKLKDSPAWSTLQAVRKGRVIVIPEKDMLSVSHHIKKAIVRLSEQLAVPTAEAHAKLKSNRSHGRHR